ncbi:Uncharacterized conserved protein, DUF1330 family [Tistlia consotensis]|uniref:Uncharacterized conserved protein, DUF1330 family n=1 Tax=Tistlia consotensis USBA 355 TaxID=560819 RepID=A0A1Y6CD50_9PROT|nr:DUF1330 domain-containing protein [Tistlia consotensis]SMF56776.1 Uncharacterized conserved protein, DUF1330 family [Tistlia consotensis USBA 355]SNR45020.1 Uncharacterized conserved protein, DUF1330 family [Tistlia consotensis]
MARAYVISDVAFRDRAALERYRTLAAASMARHGGRYLVRGGPVEALEGSWQPAALIVVEFPDRQAAQAWYRSPDYAEALAFRDAALSRDLILAEGVG